MRVGVAIATALCGGRRRHPAVAGQDLPQRQASLETVVGLVAVAAVTYMIDAGCAATRAGSAGAGGRCRERLAAGYDGPWVA